MPDQHLYQSPCHRHTSLQIIITLTEDAYLIFLQSGVEKLLAWPKIEPIIINLLSQSGAYDLSAMATNHKNKKFVKFIF